MIRAGLCRDVLLLLLLLTATAGAIQAQPLVLNDLPSGSLGAKAELLVEEGAPLEFEEVQKLLRKGAFVAATQAVLTSGIGSRPIWVHLELLNPTTSALDLSLVIGTTWADRLDAYVVRDGKVSASWYTGDNQPHPPGLTPGVGYSWPVSFVPGRSELYIRVDMVDPLVLPIALLTEAQARSGERLVQYSYGLIYGFVLALLAYNAMLFFGLRERSYLYYALYLASLILMSVAYTGHGYAWLWPDSPELQRYVILVLMVLYGCSGLVFASRFLGLAEHAPRARHLVRIMIWAGLGLMTLSIVSGSQLAAALVAFGFALLFAASMALLGILTVRHGKLAGRYFLVASVFGMLGAASTTLAVLGWLPFNTLTYRAVEFGMLIEATLLALALAHRFSEMDANLSMVTVSRDVLSVEIAERKLVEERLRKSEESLRESQRIASLGSYVLDISTGRWESSEVLDQLLGIDKTYERSLTGWLDLFHPEDRKQMEELMRSKGAVRGRAMDCECRIIRHNDHTERWIYGLARMEVDQQGRPLKMHGTIQDVTDRKLAETELRIAATAFEAQEGMMITDADNVILRVNSAFTGITGYTADEAVGRNPHMLGSNRQDDGFYAEMWEGLRSDGKWAGEIWNRRKNGEIYPEYLIITAVKEPGGAITNYVATFNDITASKAAADEIRGLAFYDPLTHLPNRRLLLDRLKQALASSARSGRTGALLFLDMDNFKSINDTLGHDIGDLLLQQVAVRLGSCVREGDTVARLGGDEFVVMLEDLDENALDAAAQTEAIGEKILAALNQPYQLAAHGYRGSTSIGATLLKGHEQGVDELLKQADIAMYQAKKAGRNALRFFDPAMQANVTARVTLETDLRHAITAQGQMLLYYQAQVDSSGRVTGAEALVRWWHPQRGMVYPGEFISLAEESGLILPLGHWVMSTACQQLAVWAMHPETEHLTVAVNVSSKQFSLPVFVEEVLALVDYYGVEPGKLKLEITESMLLENVDEMIVKMAALKARGIRFSMDDFGTGYSSLQYLKRLPLDQIKIDQSFVRDIAADNSNREIVRTIIAMAQSLGLNVIAEGVETEQQCQFLMEEGCQFFQGYLFGRPVPIEKFEALLRL